MQVLQEVLFLKLTLTNLNSYIKRGGENVYLK